MWRWWLAALIGFAGWLLLFVGYVEACRWLYSGVRAPW